MKPEIVLVYDRDCPNAPAARAVLREALQVTGFEAEWTEYCRASLATPEEFRPYGSPTILVDGTDVAGDAPSVSGACCRVYPNEWGLRGVPPRDWIVDAIVRRSRKSKTTVRRINPASATRPGRMAGSPEP